MFNFLKHFKKEVQPKLPEVQQVQEETISEKKSILELSREVLKIERELDFTKSLHELKRDGDKKFFSGDTEDEIKIKLSHFNSIYRNPMFKEYCEYLINFYATKSLYESETELQMLASRMTIYGINEVLSSVKYASELYEQTVYKLDDMSLDERYELL